MLKRFFRRSADDPDDGTGKERQIYIEGQDEHVQEAMDLLSQEDQGDLDEALVEVTETVREAAKASLRDIKLMEEGHCPACGHKNLRRFLFTTVCSSCGWFSFISPEEGKSHIHLQSGRIIECGTTFETKGGFVLGITDGVVRAKVPKDNVEYVEFDWTQEEIQHKRESRAREETGICSWCEKTLTDSNDENVIVYAAFGTIQERFVFCSNKCNEAFQKQYPIRIHKNCYERSCLDCDLCNKRYRGEDETFLKLLEQGKI